MPFSVLAALPALHSYKYYKYFSKLSSRLVKEKKKKVELKIYVLDHMEVSIPSHTSKLSIASCSDTEAPRTVLRVIFFQPLMNPLL